MTCHVQKRHETEDQRVFYAPGVKNPGPYTECYACGARKNAHGPKHECPDLGTLERCHACTDRHFAEHDPLIAVTDCGDCTEYHGANCSRPA